MTGDLNPGALAWGPGLCNYNHLSRGFSWTSRTESFAEAKRVPFQVPGCALLGLSLLPLGAGLTGALFPNRSRPAGGTYTFFLHLFGHWGGTDPICGDGEGQGK